MIRGISPEKVLNSRCSCDLDNYPKKGHWGIFVKDKYPTQKTMQHIIRCCEVPQFSNKKLSLWHEDKYLFLGFEKTSDRFKTRLLHIESGMQHEAVYLASTALGAGTCIHNLGINGTEYRERIATARQLIMNSADSYETGNSTTVPPGPEKPFKIGKNLKEPRRDSDAECIPALEHLSLSRSTATQAEGADISQLLWAAKGRTPHYVKSHPWGLTIPTWGGGQNFTTVYLVKENRLFRYVNWTTETLPLWRISTRAQRAFWWTIGNPTHDIRFLKKIDISSLIDGANFAIILTRNENTNRALWEVGYMLENMILQATSLKISYTSKVFDIDTINQMAKSHISEAVAAIIL